MQHLALVTAAIILAVSAPVHGTEQAAPAAREEAMWSLGAGMGSYSGYYVGYMGNYFATLPDTPSSVIFMERKVTPKVWLLASIEGNYSKTDDQDSIISGTMPEVTSKSVMGTLGARYVFNPGGAVELSLYGAASLYFLTITGEDPSASDPNDMISSQNGYKGAIGSVGLAVERKLMKNLYLRLSTTLASVSYSTLTHEEKRLDGSTVRDTSSTWEGGINFKPTLQLRLAF